MVARKAQKAVNIGGSLNYPMGPRMAKTIAIVEDDPDQRANYSDAIIMKGYKVNAYGSREEALEGFDQALPDLVILDIILGEEVDAGFQLCRDLLARAPSLPVIFLTERINEIDKISGLRLGAWDYLPKPISLDYLAERISSLLRINEVRAENKETESPTAKKIGEEALTFVAQINIGVEYGLDSIDCFVGRETSPGSITQ